MFHKKNKTKFARAFQNSAGFTLIEAVVATGVFIIFALGIYSGIQFVFKIVYQSKLRIVETGILNEQIEIIRNLPFEDVGIVSGSPAGVLSRTATTTSNGINFLLTRTIRNIDDPADGTIDGTPKDIAPTDYKLAEVEIICLSPCLQRKSLSLTTYIAPKFLEGDPDHGALFIEVFDADIHPVQGAEVHVVSTSTDPAVDLVDTTDNDGMLRLVDLGQGISVYDITVSKPGYTTDQTRWPSPVLLHPTKSPASVTAQDVVTIGFAIDEVSSIDLSSINAYCAGVGGVPVNVVGTKVIGTEPDVFLVDQNIITNGSGNYTLDNLVWDNYGFRVTGYDLLGTIPGQAVNLSPGADQPVQLVLGANTANSVVIHVRDNGNHQSLSSAVVHIHGGSLDQTKTTGVGFVRQADWSGGSGQYLVGEEDSYWADDGKLDVINFPGDIKLAQVGQSYVSNGYLESSVFDLGASVDFVNINWEPMAQPVEAGIGAVRFQIATSNSSTPESWEYLGPDGTTGTYYNSENFAINSIHNGNRYLRYKLFLRTENTAFTPTVSDISFTYTNTCTPPGQAYFGNLASGQEYTVEVSRSGYEPIADTFFADGDIVFLVDMVAD